MKSKLMKVLVSCIIVGAIGMGGYYGYNKYFKAKPAVTTVSYITATARKMNMQVNIQGTGAVYAAVSKDIMPNNNGTIKDLNINVGDTVKAGAKLFTVDSDDLRQNVTKAQNSLDKQKLTLADDQAKPNNDSKIAQDNLAITDAQNQLNYAWQQVNKTAVTSPINGVVITKNNSNGDSAQSGKAVLTIIDTSSMKIKVSVDELDIAKVKEGQKAEIKFGAIKDKTYEGAVESIAQTGTSTNNVTTYDVVISIKDTSNIKIGMNANVNILVDSKENALTIPAESLVERNGKKYVMVQSAEDTNAASKTNANATDKQNAATQGAQNGQSNEASPSGQNGQTSGGNSQRQRGNGQTRQTSGNTTGAGWTGTVSGGKLVEIKTGLENENYIEILEGITEGQKVLIALPQNTTSTTNNNRNNFGGGLGGSFGGGMGGNNRQQQNQNTSQNNSKK